MLVFFAFGFVGCLHESGFYVGFREGAIGWEGCSAFDGGGGERGKPRDCNPWAFPFFLGGRCARCAEGALGFGGGGFLEGGGVEGDDGAAGFFERFVEGNEFRTAVPGAKERDVAFFETFDDFVMMAGEDFAVGKVGDDADDGEGVGVHGIVSCGVGKVGEFHVGGAPAEVLRTAEFGDEEAVGVFGSDGGEHVEDVADGGVAVEDGDAHGFGGGDFGAGDGEAVGVGFGEVLGVFGMADVVGIGAEGDANAEAGGEDELEGSLDEGRDVAGVAFVIASGVWAVEAVGIPEDEGLAVEDFEVGDGGVDEGCGVEEAERIGGGAVGFVGEEDGADGAAVGPIEEEGGGGLGVGASGEEEEGEDECGGITHGETLGRG